jgi:uncharacterized protein (TIGR00725 family)
LFSFLPRISDDDHNVGMVRLVSVVGGSSCSAEEALTAEQVGRLLAGRGFGVVCGGLGGVMEAACKGCAGAGGRTVGILPGDKPGDANPYVTVALPTGLGEARNVLVAKAGEGMIAVGGEFGTLSEVAFALKMGKPVVALDKWSGVEGVVGVHSADEAVQRLVQVLGS